MGHLDALVADLPGEGIGQLRAEHAVLPFEAGPIQTALDGEPQHEMARTDGAGREEGDLHASGTAEEDRDVLLLEHARIGTVGYI